MPQVDGLLVQNPDTCCRLDSWVDGQKYPLNTVLLTNCVTPYFLPVLQHLSRALQQFHVLISTPMESDRPWQPKWDGLDVTVQRTITRIHRRTYRQGFSLDSFRHYPYDTLLLLQKLRPQMVISSQLGFRTLQAAAYRLSHPNSRLVIWVDLSEHTEREIGRLRNTFRRNLLSVADSIVVNGFSGMRYLERLGISRSRIVIAPYAADPQLFGSVSLERPTLTAHRVLYVGQLIECKGLMGFLSALSQWAAKHPAEKREVVLVGDGPLMGKLRALSLPSSVQLQFVGSVPYNELPKYFSQAGILVLPSLSDTWGLVVNEALAAGIPVLGSVYSQAVEELVSDGINGWTFRPDNAEEIDRAFSSAFSATSGRLAKMRSAARSSVTQLTPVFTASRFLDAMTLAMKDSVVQLTTRSKVAVKSARTQALDGQSD